MHGKGWVNVVGFVYIFTQLHFPAADPPRPKQRMALNVLYTGVAFNFVNNEGGEERG